MNNIVATVKFERKRCRDRNPEVQEDELNGLVIRAMEEYIQRHYDPLDHRAIANLLNVYIPGTGVETMRPLSRRNELKLKDALSSFVPVVDIATQDQETVLSIMEIVKQKDAERLAAFI
ncbi:hypothetical protein BGX27_001877 [Mortierella sp. AM989]|nr:hypothetical protein BGX27_001877 [Mortierella sp. AM989]